MRENPEILKGTEFFCPICRTSNGVIAYEETKGRKYTVHIGCYHGCIHIQRAVIIANDKDQENKKKAIALARSAWLEVVSGRNKFAKWEK